MKLICDGDDRSVVLLMAAVKTLTMDQDQSPRLVNKLESSWANQTQIVKEPHHCSSLRNLILCFPGEDF